MVSRSSIFSFEFLPKGNPLGRAGAMALVTFFVIRLVLLARPLEFYEPADYTVRAFHAFEIESRLPARANPKVVILGTSRLLRPKQTDVAGALGIPKTDVATFYRNGSDFWWCATLLRRNPHILRNAKVVVIDILPYQIYYHPWLDESDPIFTRYATIQERLRVVPLSDRLRAVGDFIAPVWSETNGIYAWCAGARNALGESSERASGQPADDALDRKSPVARNNPKWLGNATLSTYLVTPNEAPNQMAAIESIISMMPADGKLLLIMPPLATSTTEMSTSEPEFYQRYVRFQTYIEKLARPGVITKFFGDHSEEGFVAADYVDVAHFSASGQDKLARFLARAIAETSPFFDVPPGVSRTSLKNEQ